MNAPTSIFQLGNPFVPRAADRLGGFPSTVGIGAEEEPRQAHVETEAMAKLREEVKNYLERPARGRALALVGPYGIGKTHLTREIITLIRSQEGPPPLWMMDGALLDLADLYQDRLMSLRDDRNQQAVFEDLVSDYLGDVTAAELEREDDPGGRRTDIIQGLREREYDPEKVARALRLDTERIHRGLRRHLHEITEHRKFATALALMLEPDFNLAVWDWLSGHPPREALIDRGIDEPISGINQIFETLAVFAFVYGTGRKPYVMVIDALENVFDWEDLDRNIFIDAFLRLVNIYISRGGLLIFCIPPEPLGKLPTSLHERTLQFWPTGLTDEQAAELVKEYVAPVHAAARAASAVPVPADDLAPFTREAVAEISELLNGNPRWMLTTCSQAWDTAEELAEELSDPARKIDVSVVHRAVRTLFERVPRDHVLSAIGDALTAGQWRTEQGGTRFARRAAGRAGRVEYWVHVARSSVLAIMVCDSILVGAQLDDLEQDIKAARDDVRGGAEVLLVVNGLLSPRLRQRLVGIARTQPISYDDQRFPRRLHTALTELARRLEAAEQADYAAALQVRVGQLDGRQTEVLDHLRQLDGRLDRLAAPAADAAAAASACPELPAPVRALFDEAYRALDLLGDISLGLDRALGIDQSADVPADARPRRLGFTAEQFQTLGVSTMMRRLLQSFEHDVADWLRAVPSGRTDAGLTDEQRRRLFVICRGFEITTEVMPLGELAAPADFGTTATPLSAIERRDRALGRAEAEDVFNRLAAAVRNAATRAVTTGPGGERGQRGEGLT